MFSTPASCPLCGARAKRTARAWKGYVEPATFELHSCSSCATGFAQPLVSDPVVYDLIYDRSALLPGYDRYARYAEKVAARTDPLDWLASEEDAYWAVARTIEEMSAGQPLRVLEVGCGLGYLTYALDRAGHDAVGIDISAAAIDRARERYDARFERVAVESVPAGWGPFDLIIACELFEHVEDPETLAIALMRHAEPTGRVLITTPDRRAYSRRARWSEDPPPVHLWWFSRQSFLTIAAKNSWKCKFVDFDRRVNERGGSPVPQSGLPARPSEHHLARDGRVLRGPAAPFGPRVRTSVRRRIATVASRIPPASPTAFSAAPAATLGVLLSH